MIDKTKLRFRINDMKSPKGWHIYRKVYKFDNNPEARRAGIFIGKYINLTITPKPEGLAYL
jgi:hypothetical protein